MQFLSNPFLHTEICECIKQSKNALFLACPFLMLHDHHKSAFRRLKNRDVKINILYGKHRRNDDFKLSTEDLEFFKSFENIELRYNSKLHAKYYSNDAYIITTSLNLNHTSHNNNHEYGFKFELNEDLEAIAELQEWIHEVYEDSTIEFKSENYSGTSNPTEYHDRISKIREKHPKAYFPWTVEEDEMLEKAYCESKSVDEMSKSFQRQPSAIRSRLNKLEVYEKYG